MIVSGIPESEALASAVWSLAGGESRLCQLALMWLVVNQRRVSGGADSLLEICRRLRESELAQSCDSNNTNDTEASSQMVEMARSVLLEEAVDPTFGAWRVHHHTECPEWSAGLVPTALIGPFLFYAPDFRGSGASGGGCEAMA